MNEPVRSYAPGSPERVELKAELERIQGERIELPLVIGGKDVTTGDDLRGGDAAPEGATCSPT